MTEHKKEDPKRDAYLQQRAEQTKKRITMLNDRILRLAKEEAALAARSALDKMLNRRFFEGRGAYLFIGPPGTGKTAAARLLEDILRAKNIRTGEFHHIGGAELAETVSTAAEMEKVLGAALGGVLLIDGFGALTALPAAALGAFLGFTKEHRRDVTVILEGSEEEVKALVEKAPAFAVWAEHVRRFEPFSPEKLLEIFLAVLRRAEGVLKEKFVLDAGLSEALLSTFARVQSDEARSLRFANAHGAKAMADRMLRFAVAKDRRDADGRVLITEEDLQRA